MTDPLLEPFTLKGLTLKNRVMSTSHAISYDIAGIPEDRYQRYHEEKAKGGLALTMFGGSANIARDSPSVFGQLYIGDDSIIPVFQQFADRIHRHDCALMCQITHLGRRGSSTVGEWLPVPAPSRVRETLHRSIPREMDTDDVDRIVAAYGAAARRCRLGGLDGIEIVASAHLIGQFLSPVANRRDDAFGGSLENRARFGMLVLDAIRKEVGTEFIVGMRLSMHEGGEAGLERDECLRIAQLFQASGMIDFFNVMYGRMDTQIALTEQNMPGMGIAKAPFLEPVAWFRNEVNLPVFHAARVTDVATARGAVAEGAVDLIGMTRGHIADPHIINKIVSGHEDRIRPCIGANLCISPSRACVHNAAIGREASLPHVIKATTEPARKVVIIGAGPAGLEAARVCGSRRHDVVLIEAGEIVGGQVLGALAPHWRADLGNITNWLHREVGHLGVDVRLSTTADAAMVIAESPSVVIIATGGRPDRGSVPGSHLCTTAADAITGPIDPADQVIVYDGTGDHQAAACAQHLAERQASVHFVSQDKMFGQNMGDAEQMGFRKRLYSADVSVTLDHRLIGVVEQNGALRATFVNCLTGHESKRTADRVVVEHGTTPTDELFHTLQPLSRNNGVTDIDALIEGRPQHPIPTEPEEFDLYRVGDAVASRNIHAAILDSLRLCVTL